MLQHNIKILHKFSPHFMLCIFIQKKIVKKNCLKNNFIVSMQNIILFELKFLLGHENEG